MKSIRSSSRNISTLQIPTESSLSQVIFQSYCQYYSLTVVTLSLDSSLVYFAQNSTYLGPIPGTTPTGVTSAVGFNENATLPFVPGKTYRLRIVNTSAFAMFFFWIDGHEMRIIEVDGVRAMIVAL
jgi:FtsP/CotA-like multicopper oxidase with cupredoxin domain